MYSRGMKCILLCRTMYIYIKLTMFNGLNNPDNARFLKYIAARQLYFIFLWSETKHVHKNCRKKTKFINIMCYCRKMHFYTNYIIFLLWHLHSTYNLKYFPRYHDYYMLLKMCILACYLQLYSAYQTSFLFNFEAVSDFHLYLVALFYYMVLQVTRIKS